MTLHLPGEAVITTTASYLSCGAQTFHTVSLCFVPVQGSPINVWEYRFEHFSLQPLYCCLFYLKQSFHQTMRHMLAKYQLTQEADESHCHQA